LFVASTVMGGQLLLASWLSRVVAPGFPPGKAAALAEFLRLTSPVVLLATCSAVGQSIALFRHAFARAASGPVLNGIGLLAITRIGSSGHPSVGRLGLAVLGGYAAQCLWMVPELAHIRGRWSRGRSDFDRSSSGRILSVVGIPLEASLLYKSQPIVERLIASTLAPGSAATLGYSAKLAQGLVTLSTFGLATVAMPRYSESLAWGRREEAAGTLAVVFGITYALSVLVVGALATSAPVVVRLVFGRGDMSFASERDIVLVLLAYIPWILGGSLAGPLVGIYYAENRQRWVAAIGAVGIALGAVASFGLSRAIGSSGVVLGSGIGSAFPLIAFAHQLKRHLPSWSWRRMNSHALPATVSVGVGSAVALVATHLLWAGLPKRGNYLGLLSVLAAQGALFLAGSALAAICCRWDPRHLLQAARRAEGAARRDERGPNAVAIAADETMTRQS